MLFLLGFDSDALGVLLMRVDLLVRCEHNQIDDSMLSDQADRFNMVPASFPFPLFAHMVPFLLHLPCDSVSLQTCEA